MMTRRWSTFVLLSLVILVVAGIGWAGSDIFQRFVIDMLVKLVVVLGLAVFVGNSGVFSFGHASFAALGAYSAAWFTLPVAAKKIFLPQLPAFALSTQLGLPMGAAIGVAFASLVGLVIGVIIVQLSGLGASIATVAWLAIVTTVLANADAYTRGTSSLVGLPLATGIGTALVSALLALFIAFLFKTSRYGLMLQASREDEVAAKATGISVRAVRLWAFVLSAALVALGGILQGHFRGVLTVSQFYFEFTYLTLAMLVIGGIRSLSGAVIGTFLVAGCAEMLRIVSGGFEVAGLMVPALPGLREIGLALMMLIVLLARPRGIMGSREFTWPVKTG